MATDVRHRGPVTAFGALWHGMVLHRAARHYVRHGWPVVPGAVLVGGRFACGPLCQTVGCHPARQGWRRSDGWEHTVLTEPAELATWWARQPYGVLLATGRAFDVVEVPARMGAIASAVARLANGPTTGPVVVTPAGHWMFLVAPGAALHPRLHGRADVVLHGAGSWVPAPPTPTPYGRVRWARHPSACGWRLPDAYAVQDALLAHDHTRHHDDMRHQKETDTLSSSINAGEITSPARLANTAIS
jgi:bifunctional DNA primase/polymerase-like protein